MNAEAGMQHPTVGDERSRAELSASALRMFRPTNPVVALGFAVSYLMTKPAFAKLLFGDWSRILVGQINRGHYYLVIDGNRQVQGFFGWALATKEKAEAWVEGRRGLSYEDSREGDCLIFNAWSANSPTVHRFMLDEARKVAKDKETVYFKRHYEDGSIKPVRLNVNDFVGSHIGSKMSELDTGSSPGRDAVKPSPMESTRSPTQK